MNILFYLPQPMLEHCFAPQQLERLQSTHKVLLPQSVNAQELLTEYNQTAPQSEALITGWDSPPLTDTMLDAAPSLKVLIHSAGSIKALVPPSIWHRDIRVATCNDALAVGVAETTLGCIITGLKGVFPARDWTTKGHWQDPKLGTNRVLVRELFDVTIGIIGASKVGRHVIRLLQSFETNIVVADPFLSEDAAKSLGVTRVSLEELVACSDVISLHAPVLPSTRKMLKRQHFQSMKNDAIFINTARGALLDEAALVDELKTGRIFAFIDVTDPEPPAADHPFRSLPNVALTPHISGHLSNGVFRQGRSAVEQLLEYSAGKTMHGEVTEAMFNVMG
ncbi:MAG: hydroxyacid dehydrogenase [Abditibacteriaceae bacterium]